MPFYTRPNIEDRQMVQYSGDTITLSGDTYISNIGTLQINGTILDFTGSTTANTQYIIAGVTGYINASKPSSLIVQPPIILQSGSTGTTTVDVTNYILGGLDSKGSVTWFPASHFFTGGTGGGTGTTYVTIDFTGNTSGNCINDIWVSNISGCNVLHVQPYNNGDVYMIESGGKVAIGYPTFTPQTILHLKGENSGSIDTFMITSSTNQNKIWVTDNGATYFDNSASLTLRTGVTFTIETNPVAGYVLTSDSFGGATWQPAPSGGTGTTTIIQFTGNTSATCITDLYVQHINSCSPLYFQDYSIGDIIALINGNGNFGIGRMPTEKLDVSGKTKTIELQVTNGAVNGYVLTSDAFGNATWQPASSGSTTVSGATSPYIFGPNSLDIVTVSGNNFTLSNYSLVLGGQNNISQGTAATIINGNSNTITSSTQSFIGGGTTHLIQGSARSLIGTGTLNTIFGSQGSSIINGDSNTINTSTFGFIGGGGGNNITGSAPSAQNSILNGSNNTISGSVSRVVIAGGSNNSISTSHSLIGTGKQHSISNGDYAGIVIGDTNSIIGPLFPSTYSLIGGGVTNTISNSTHSFIGNGFNNTINVLGIIGGYNTIVNGNTNTVSTAVNYSTILGGTNNTINYSYSSINGGQSNTVQHSNTHIIGSNITTTEADKTYVEKFNAGASSVNSYQGHFNVNDYNTFGPIRPNYISDLITSGNTTGGTYNISILSGWVVTDVQIYTKTSDTLGSVFGATIGTSGSIWDPTTPKAFTPSHNIISLFSSIPENGVHYFSSSDTLNVNFVDASAIPTNLTNGEYKVFITYWVYEPGIF